jgi:hypothetical protein
MNYTYTIPSWFFGFDIGMELLFAIITITVSIFAMKVYNISKERKIKIFAAAFGLIGISYIVWAFANLWFVQLIGEGFKQVSLNDFLILDIMAAYSFMVVFTLGLVLLVYVACDIKDLRFFSLIFGLSLMVIAASTHKLVTFRILSVFLLFFIVMHYVNEFAERKGKRSLSIMIAFSLLLLGSADFILSPVYYQAYVIGHLLELAAYLIILTLLVKSVKK